MDIYPTLVDLAGLPDPKSNGEHINGTSMGPVFEDPTTMVKTEAYSQFAKTSYFDIDAHFIRNQTALMGCVRRPACRCPVPGAAECALSGVGFWSSL